MISNSNSTGKNYTQLNGAIAACLSVAIYFVVANGDNSNFLQRFTSVEH